MYRTIYGEKPVSKEEPKAEVKADQIDSTQEVKKDEEEPEKKPKKKVKFGKNEGLIKVTKLHRGGKKIICQITGFEFYTKDLKALASKFGKKFSCGAAVAQDDIYGECVSVQGDVEDRLMELLETDKDFMKLEIPLQKVEFEDMGNKKGRKRV